jgi:hypothetical protein
MKTNKLLQERIAAKQLQLYQQEEQLKNMFNEVVNMLSPGYIIKESAADILKTSLSGKSLVRGSLAWIVAYAINKFILKKTEPATQDIIVGFVKDVAEAITQKDSHNQPKNS